MTTETLDARDGVLGRLIGLIGRKLMPRDLTGGLTLTLPSGRTHRIGYARQGVSCDLQLRNYRPVWSAMRRGAIGFAESVMAGDVDSSDLTAVLRFYLQNRPALNAAARPVFSKSPADRLFHLLRPNTRTGARRNISAHYDLGNEFYALWLDRTMSYSSACFGSGAQTLDAAQGAKYDLVLGALDLARPSDILEIGCGWGGFLETAARHGHRVTGLTISQEQLDYARKRLGGQAEVRFQDYRDTRESFDAIASIEVEAWRTMHLTAEAEPPLHPRSRRPQPGARDQFACPQGGEGDHERQGQEEDRRDAGGGAPVSGRAEVPLWRG